MSCLEYVTAANTNEEFLELPLQMSLFHGQEYRHSRGEGVGDGSALHVAAMLQNLPE